MTKEQRGVLIDIDFGRHSGIPDCCIMEYIFDYMGGNWIKTNKKKFKLMGDKHWGYIPCYKCLKKGKVAKVHHCYEGCGSEKIKSIPRSELKHYPGHEWMTRKK